MGEGSFGQVYTCVNIDTGEILAMKEVCAAALEFKFEVDFINIFLITAITMTGGVCFVHAEMNLK